jgi:hypothetical protein
MLHLRGRSQHHKTGSYASKVLFSIVCRSLHLCVYNVLPKFTISTTSAAPLSQRAASNFILCLPDWRKWRMAVRVRIIETYHSLISPCNSSKSSLRTLTVLPWGALSCAIAFALVQGPSKSDGSKGHNGDDGTFEHHIEELLLYVEGDIDRWLARGP